MQNTVLKYAGKAAWALPVLFLVGWLGFPVTYVDPSSTAVVTTFGAVSGTMENGMHMVMPFQAVSKVRTQLVSVSVTTTAPTKDLQEVKATASFQFALVPGGVGDVYEHVGTIDEVKTVILDPGVQEVLKAVTAQYSLADLLDKRDPASLQTRDALESWVKTSLDARKLGNLVNVGSLQLTNLEYSQVFKEAVANKSEVVQKVPTARNNRDAKIAAAQGEAARIKRKADADAANIRVTAQAEAKGMREKAAKLNQHPELPCYLLHKKWNGVVPSVQGGGAVLPFYEQACGKH